MSRNTQTNELLGYPTDARLLVVNCDDFGVCHAENEATIHAIKEGVGSSCTIMMPCPWGLHGIHLLKENPDIPFGVHLTLVAEYPRYRWKPLSSPDKVPSLVDEAGYLMSPARQDELLQRFELSEVEAECRAQVEVVLSSGLKPTHLDSHWHFHELRDDIFDMTVGLAVEYGLALRAGYAPRSIQKLRAKGYPTNDALADFGGSKASDLPVLYPRLLRELSAGLNEWCAHVGCDSPELRALMPVPEAEDPDLADGIGTWEGRQADLDFWTSEEAKDIIEEEGIVVLSYEPLRRLWQAM